MSSKTAALIWGVIFIAVGLLGFIDNPIIGESAKAMFHADTVHNCVHIASGLLFLIAASMGSGSGFMMLFGVIYLAIGIVGFISVGTEGMGKILGFLHVNGKDNYLHCALGVLIFLTGIATRGGRVTA